jgi:SAM-dependent methyltransferase
MEAFEPSFRQSAPAPGDFGLLDALRQAAAELGEASAALEGYRAGRAPRRQPPFRFDSERLCVDSYVAALSQVRERFWATTFLSSGFWTQNGTEVLDANLRMLRELERNRVAPRRLFLLRVSPEAEVQRWEDERILLRKHEDADGLRRFDARFSQLRRNIGDLIAHGCDVRVIHDGEALHESLPRELDFDPHDSELAIYDDWRLDVFRGGRQGSIASVQCFTPVMEGFPVSRDLAIRYFEELWGRARPIHLLLERIGRALEASSARIDYPTVWLARYDHGLPEADRVLKTAELCCVKADLQRLGRWGAPRRFLDVGTCTGRYPISLRDAVHADGEILGIDIDLDCVRFARWNVRQQCPGDLRLRIERQDFCADEFAPDQPFDLITCMLGTLLHFGAGGSGDAFQRALEKLARLLSRDGLFFFSVWTEEACARLDLLSIYSEEDMRQLAQWTPPREELQNRLRAAGLEIDAPLSLEGRMDLYRCRHL